ncbi:hypothetical protein C1X72_27990 [Pseudomonas sp. FW306-2-2C-D06B]|nr:hypothetical protein C1X72_27990 [Pseudomonas sp. FW306-2-2C-D06B]PNA91512.1 hypothetical protein C1X74_24650 [Pseudomonas sp. GW460-5]PNB58422.1 hypothetical protein C1X73_14005 [Pseudomonas sp. FW305-130]
MGDELGDSLNDSADLRGVCGSGLASRKGCTAAPGFQLRRLNCRGRFAALPRRKAAPTWSV